MPSVYADRLNRVRSAVDSAFGDRVLVTPMAKAQRHGLGQRAPDPERAGFEITAKLMITRRGDYLMFGGLFPRLQKQDAKGRLGEIHRLLRQLAPPPEPKRSPVPS